MNVVKVDSSIPAEEVAAQRELRAREEEMKKHRIKKKRKRSTEEGEERNKTLDEEAMKDTPTLEKALNAISMSLDVDDYSDDDIQESSIPCIRYQLLSNLRRQTFGKHIFFLSHFDDTFFLAVGPSNPLAPLLV